MILIVEDSDLHREATAELLRSRGYAVRSCATAEEAMALIVQRPPRVLVLDLMLPGAGGMAVLEGIDPAATVVFVTTALPDPLPALPAGVTVLRKPFAVEELAGAIARLAPLEKPDARPIT